MVIISNKAIRFFEWILRSGGIRALAFFPFIIIPDTTVTDQVLINHEKIHLRQQAELLIIPFYIWYLIAYYTKGYYNVSFEREAYANERDMSYLSNRPLFAFLKYNG
jgi:hypothetical protein